MNAFQSVILRFLRCIADASHVLSRPAVLVPFAAISLLQLALLCAYVFFAWPLFSWVSPHLIEAFGGGDRLHYPAHLLALPDVVVCIRVTVWIAVGFLVLRSVAQTVWARLDEPARRRRAPAVRRGVPAVALFVAGAAFWGLFAALHWFLGRLGGAHVLGLFGIFWGALDAVLAPLATLALVNAWVAMGQAPGVLRGTATGMRSLVSDAAPAMTVAVSVAILSAPFHLLTAGVESFVRNGRPGVAVFGAAAALVWDAPMRTLLVVSAISLVMGRRDGTQ